VSWAKAGMKAEVSPKDKPGHYSGLPDFLAGAEFFGQEKTI